jgi:hypothetical protein
MTGFCSSSIHLCCAGGRSLLPAVYAVRRINWDITVNKMCHSVALKIWMGHNDRDFVKVYWSTNGLYCTLVVSKIVTDGCFILNSDYIPNRIGDIMTGCWISEGFFDDIYATLYQYSGFCFALLFNTVGAEVANGDSSCLCMP